MAGDAERHVLRATFERVPELYDRARPVYPDELFDDLVALARVPAHGRVLEIGCGTGKATAPLAVRGLEVVCVELGERLAALAREKLTPFPNVDVVVAQFESWEHDGQPFDAVVAFTSFHWLDPDVRFAKAARVLRDGGALAVTETQHVRRPGGDEFWANVQEDYDAVVPSEDNRPPPYPDEVPDMSAELDASGTFRTAAVRRYLWDVRYDADEYLAVLDTYSGHRSMAEKQRLRLYERIRRRIETTRDSAVTKTYLATLNVARRV